jgi:hypothetical protein
VLFRVEEEKENRASGTTNTLRNEWSMRTSQTSQPSPDSHGSSELASLSLVLVLEATTPKLVSSALPRQSTRQNHVRST